MKQSHKKVPAVSFATAQALLTTRLNERQYLQLGQFFRHLMVGKADESVRYYSVGIGVT